MPARTPTWPAAQEPPPRIKDSVVRRLRDTSAATTTQAIGSIEQRYAWFGSLDAEDRSWVTVVARAGIDGFVAWLTGDGSADPSAIFAAAPRALQRHISLQRTVEVMRSIIDTVDAQIEKSLPRGDRPAAHLAVLHYSREVAFAAAAVYARAAESRGAWDARLEAMVVDAVIRGEADESAVSQASTLGWQAPRGVVFVVGDSPEDPAFAIESVRRQVNRQGWDVLAAPHGERLVMILGGDFEDLSVVLPVVSELSTHFGPGAIVVGPVVPRLEQAVASARPALAGVRAVRAWASAPRPVAASELLPERALAGDGHARRTLAQDIYTPLAASGGDLLETLIGFSDHGGSIEATGRALFVHPNTVRYRIRRIQEITGLLATDPRDLYVLRLAVTLGRLLS
ncbi:MAG: helix-turn-helix domain-containing protein [Micropruina sp.]|nr:helix-turn-helix domain-containing protein [Micropruina sp.]